MSDGGLCPKKLRSFLAASFPTLVGVRTSIVALLAIGAPAGVSGGVTPRLARPGQIGPAPKPDIMLTVEARYIFLLLAFGLVGGEPDPGMAREGFPGVSLVRLPNVVLVGEIRIGRGGGCSPKKALSLCCFRILRKVSRSRTGLFISEWQIFRSSVSVRGWPTRK